MNVWRARQVMGRDETVLLCYGLVLWINKSVVYNGKPPDDQRAGDTYQPKIGRSLLCGRKLMPQSDFANTIQNHNNHDSGINLAVAARPGAFSLFLSSSPLGLPPGLALIFKTEWSPSDGCYSNCLVLFSLTGMDVQ